MKDLMREEQVWPDTAAYDVAANKKVNSADVLVDGHPRAELSTLRMLLRMRAHFFLIPCCPHLPAFPLRIDFVWDCLDAWETS